MQATLPRSLLASVVGEDELSFASFLEQNCAPSTSQAPVYDDLTARCLATSSASAEEPSLYVPRYALPNTTSVLPVYGNSEGEHIFRTFHTGNYDMLRLLPNSLKEITATRTARLEAAKQLLMSSIGSTHTARPRPNAQGLFAAFEYTPSRYALADELLSTERVESEAKRMAVGSGKEFLPPGSMARGKWEGISDPHEPYPYMASPCELLDIEMMRERLQKQAAVLHGPFVQPGKQKLPLQPTRALQRDMLAAVKRWISSDWQGSTMDVYCNEQDLWVVRFALDTVHSIEGVHAYMNVFVRCNQLACEYGVTKVSQFWDVQPGDGSVYFTLRPSWMRASSTEAFYALHPEERTYRTSRAAAVAQQSGLPRDADAAGSAE